MAHGFCEGRFQPKPHRVACSGCGELAGGWPGANATTPSEVQGNEAVVALDQEPVCFDPKLVVNFKDAPVLRGPKNDDRDAFDVAPWVRFDEWSDS